jgi:hypothetical protein
LIEDVGTFCKTNNQRGAPGPNSIQIPNTNFGKFCT